MAKISLKEVVSDVKDAYVSASGDTDEITYGNIAQKVGSLGNTKQSYNLITTATKLNTQMVSEAVATHTTVTTE